MVNKALLAVYFIIFLLTAGTHAAADHIDQRLKTGGHVLLIRHAFAPGSGDPEDFRVGDCATQRNLNEQGRSQARAIGRWLRSRAIDSARIFSSQWCRCLDTAELIGLGAVAELPALNSFYGRPLDAEPNLTALRTFLSQQPADGELIVMVTHFVTISGLTGNGVSAGEGVVLRLTGAENFEVVGRLAFF